MKRIFAWLAVVGILAACDSITEPTRLGSTLDPDGAVVGGIGVSASAEGMAIRYPTLGDGSQLQVRTNFSVKEFADGSVDGWFHYAAGGVDLRVGVTCMTVVGEKAWIAGIIEKSTVGFVGHVSYFYTFDNGRGERSDPDIVSQVRVEATPGVGEAQRFCDELPELLTPHEVVDGNVVVIDH